MRPPPFWDTDAPRSSSQVTRALLSPLGLVYAAMTARRIARTAPRRVDAAVICVGNLTVGGTGKTPISLALLEMAVAAGLKPAALSRGWRGKIKGPAKVDPAVHTFKDVGDEPLLLAQQAPTYIDPGRVEGAALAVKDGAALIIMDDGHQNPKLEKDFSIVVVDAVTGWGPGTIFPAGPLREPVRAGLARADAVIVMCPDPDHQIDYAALGLIDLEIPVFKSWLVADAAPPPGPLIAFAGIGRPQKFYDGVEAAGGQIADTASFPDHHAFSKGELNSLADLADAHSASLITTQKDWVRLPVRYRDSIAAFPVRARFEYPERIQGLIQTALDRFAKSG